LPTYEYRCKNGHQFEVMQRMSDDPVTVCEVCGAPVERVFHPVAVHFKGSGFYSTDYGRNRGGGGSDASGSKDESKKEPAASKSEGKAGGDGSSSGSGAGSGSSGSGDSKSAGSSD
jgi:putative FmdB family regulatory protein